MATAARDCLVGAKQGKLGIRVMVEGDFLPAQITMTFGAVRAEGALMCVVELVAGVTGGLELVVKDMTSVTGFA